MGPAVACMEAQSQTQYLIPGWYKIVLGRNWSQTAKLRSKSYCRVAPSFYDLTPYFWPTLIWTVLYGVITVGTVITVKNPTLRRKCTGLSSMHLNKTVLRFKQGITTHTVIYGVYNGSGQPHIFTMNAQRKCTKVTQCVCPTLAVRMRTCAHVQ